MEKLFLSLLLFFTSATDLAKQMQANRDTADFRATGRLVKIEGGKRISHPVSIRAKNFSGVFKILCESEGKRLLVESYADGHSNANYSDALLDSDFSVEDLLDSQFYWKNQTLIADNVLKSVPEAGKSSYASVTTWIDPQELFPLKEEKVVKSSGAIKEYTFYGLRQTHGVWSASQIECKVKGKQGSTLLIISRGSEKAHLKESDF